MNYGEILMRVPENTRKELRNYENKNKKLIEIKWSISFNNICLNENILPKYTGVKLECTLFYLIFT